MGTRLIAEDADTLALRSSLFSHKALKADYHYAKFSAVMSSPIFRKIKNRPKSGFAKERGNARNMPIDAVIFDFDGVILDTETPLYESWREMYRRYGADLDKAHFAKYIGGADYFDFHAHLERLAGVELDRAALGGERRRLYGELVSDETALPGVEDRIADAKRLGVKLGLASNSDIGWVKSNLEKLGLFRHFDVVRTRDDVVRVKPDPEIYQSALRALGAAPENAIAIEDSANGARAAKAAGAFTIAVPNPITALLPLDAADLIIPSLADMTLERMMEIRGG